MPWERDNMKEAIIAGQVSRARENRTKSKGKRVLCASAEPGRGTQKSNPLLNLNWVGGVGVREPARTKGTFSGKT